MIIVTGGAGFTGTNIVGALTERGHDRVVVCDTLGDDDKWRIDPIHSAPLFIYYLVIEKVGLRNFSAPRD